MKSLTTTVAVAALILLLTGCAGSSDFVRVNDDALVLGQTTQEQINARLGKPYREGVVTKNGQQVKTASYGYASAGGEAAADGVTPARVQGFYFFNDKLVGYEFTSSWKADSTDFDSGKVAQIKKGVSTRSDVVDLLGNPGGKYIYPLVKNNNEEAVNYLYGQTKGSAFNLQFYQKLLVVTFNENGMVTDVDYSESGKK